MSDTSDLNNHENLEDGNIFVDGSGPISRSSVTHVAYIVSKFDDVKKGLVRDIGFAGILDLPQITKVDRKFTLWLLRQVDPEKRSISVNDECVADLIDYEVARIMGIPCGRREVCSLDCADKKKKLEFIKDFIGCSHTDINSLTAAEINVKAEYDSPSSMTLTQKDNFKVSFVVWVMGHLLAPTKKHNVGCDRFWGALLAPDEIKQFNWSAYVIDELLAAAIDVQNTLKQGKSVKIITGCSILLQILYFESIQMGSLNRPRDITPRVKAYDAKSLSLMIAADKACSASGSANPTWGCSVRHIPELRNEPTHLESRTCIGAGKGDDSTEKNIISVFGKYVRDKFGDKVSDEQSAALSWFHARCTRHFKDLRLKIQDDTIDLIGRLFGTPNESIMAHKPDPIATSVQVARKAQSEPLRPPKSLLKNKRAYGSYASCYKQSGTKKRHVSFRQHSLPETLLSGYSLSDEHELDDEISDCGFDRMAATQNSGSNKDLASIECGPASNSHGKEVSLLPGIKLTVPYETATGSNMEVPSFDLGIEFESDAKQDNVLDGKTNISSQVSEQSSHTGTDAPSTMLKMACNKSTGEGTCFNGLLDTPSSNKTIEQHRSTTTVSDHTSTSRGTSSFHSGQPEASSTPKITMLSMVSVNGSSDNSMASPRAFCLNAVVATPPSVKTVEQPEFITPDRRIRSSTTSPGSLSKILAEADVVGRIIRSEESPNMNIRPWDDDYVESPVVKRSIGFSQITESPWALKLHHRIPPRDIVDKFFNDVSVCSPSLLNRSWLVHNYPRDIDLEGTWIHESFISHKALSYDVFDLAIRRLKQLDNMMYPDNSESHWRHILESEFVMFALADEISYNRRSIVEQFIGSSICYNIEDCRMTVAPAFILLNWSCYFFDFKEKCIHVIDPLFNEDKSEVFNKMHRPNITKVALSLQKCFETFFCNWCVNMGEWQVMFVQPSIQDPTPHETGLLTLMYIREFDGSKIRSGSKESFLYFKKLMLYELMSLSDNTVKAPLNITISIDD